MVVSRCLAGLVCVLACSLTVGCGGSSGPKLPDGPTGTATAKVTYDGKLITVGTLVLDSGQGYIASAPANPDGTFTLKGPKGEAIPAGTYKVGLTPPAAPDPGPGKMPEPAKIDGLPAKFYNPQSSGNTVEIKAGKQELDILLR